MVMRKRFWIIVLIWIALFYFSNFVLVNYAIMHEQAEDTYQAPTGVEEGQRGQEVITYLYHDYDELVSELERMNTEYPDLFEYYSAQERYGLDDVEGGYKVWIARVTNEALGDNKPEAAFVGGHHGNEKPGIETAIYLMDWLLTNYGEDERITYWVDNREIYVMPVINPYGWENSQRRNEDDEDVNRDYPFGPQGTPFTTISTQAVRDFWTEHLIINGLTLHGGILPTIYYPWGSAIHDTSNDESPDDKGFYILGELMSDMSGDYDRTYIWGPSNTVISYLVRGSWTPYAYASDWDSSGIDKDDYETAGLRSMTMGVEISDEHTPPESTLGSSDAINDPDGGDDGYVPKNIRASLTLIDTVEPYINWLNKDEIPSEVSPGQEVEFKWEVMGAVEVDDTMIEYGDVVDSGEVVDGTKTEGQSGKSGWYGDVYTETITMPDEPGEYYFVASAKVDQVTLEQNTPEPDVPPQSFFVNMRTNDSYYAENGENTIEGKLYWPSDVINLSVSGLCDISVGDYPESGEGGESVKISWSVSVGNDFELVSSGIENIVGPTEGEVLSETEDRYELSKNITMPAIPRNYSFVIYAEVSGSEGNEECNDEEISIEVSVPEGGYDIEVGGVEVTYSEGSGEVDIVVGDVVCDVLSSGSLNDAEIEEGGYKVIDLNGVEVLSGNLSFIAGEWKAPGVDISGLEEGMYHIVVEFESEYCSGEGEGGEFVIGGGEVVVVEEEKEDEVDEVDEEEEEVPEEDSSLLFWVIVLYVIGIVIIAIVIVVVMLMKKEKDEGVVGGGGQQQGFPTASSQGGAVVVGQGNVGGRQIGMGVGGGQPRGGMGGGVRGAAKQGVVGGVQRSDVQGQGGVGGGQGQGGVSGGQGVAGSGGRQRQRGQFNQGFS
jgi:hypothetical protein